MKISVATSYFNRWKQFKPTLIRFNEIYKDYDFELVVVDDGSDDENRLTKEHFNFCNFDVRLVRLPQEKTYSCPCIPFNIAFRKCTGDLVLIQNPECIHYDDIFEDLVTLPKNEYRSYTCFSADPEYSEQIQNNPLNIEDKFTGSTRSASIDGQFNSYYNHPTVRPMNYHFAAGIHKEDLDDLEGFDERYALGIGDDDREFIYRIRMKNMNLTINDKVVIHQYHKGFCGHGVFKGIEGRNYSIFQNFTKNRKSYKATQE